MGTIWKTVLAFAVILLITVFGMSITAVNVEAANAGDYMEGVSAVIRASNYNEAVIQECIEEAAVNGYLLEVEIYESETVQGVRYARVCLNYKYQLPILQSFSWKKKERII